jgi:hypothetical protein
MRLHQVFSLVNCAMKLALRSACIKIGLRFGCRSSNVLMRSYEELECQGWSFVCLGMNEIVMHTRGRHFNQRLLRLWWGGKGVGHTLDSHIVALFCVSKIDTRWGLLWNVGFPKHRNRKKYRIQVGCQLQSYGIIIYSLQFGKKKLFWTRFESNIRK